MSLAPLITAADATDRFNRIAVCGVTGVGKSTLCRTLSAAWDMPYTELDSLFHGPNWTPRESFADDVERVIRGDRWVTEVSYFGKGVGQRILERTEQLLWLDYPRRIAQPRLLKRTVRRSLTKEELWNGNTEPALWTFFTDKGHILRWEMASRNAWRERIPVVREEYPHLQIVRFGHPRETAAWLDAMGVSNPTN